MRTGIGLVCIGFALFVYVITTIMTAMVTDVNVDPVAARVIASFALFLVLMGSTVIWVSKEDK